MKLSRIFLLAVLPLSAISIIFMSIACVSAYDPDVSNYFSRGNPLPVLAIMFTCFAVAAGIAGALLSKHREDSFEKPLSPSFIPFPSAVGCLIGSILLFAAKVPIAGILFLLTAGFFVLTVCPFAKRYASLILWAGFASVAATILLNATYYFDMTVEMNAPIKVLLQMGLLAAMLDCTVEMRVLIDRTDSFATPILTTFTVTLCGLSSIPALIVQIGGKLPGLVYFAAVPVLLGFFVTALIRLCHMIFTPVQNASTPESANSENKTEEERTEE